MVRQVDDNKLSPLATRKTNMLLHLTIGNAISFILWSIHLFISTKLSVTESS